MHPGVRDCAYFHIGTSEVAVTGSAGLCCRGGDAILQYCTWELGAAGGIQVRPKERGHPSLLAIPAVSVLVHSGSLLVASVFAPRQAPAAFLSSPSRARADPLQSTVPKAQQVR